MIKPSPVRRKMETIIFAFGIVGFVALLLLMRRFNVVNEHRMQAFAIILGPGLAAQALLYLKEGRMDVPLRWQRRETKVTLQGVKLTVVGIFLISIGILGTLWSLAFWVSALPEMIGSQPPPGN